MVETATRMGTGAGGTRNIAGNNIRWSSSSANSPTCTARKRPWFSPPATSPTTPEFLRRQADAGLPDPVGRLEPQFDDRGRAPGAQREEIFRHNDMAHLRRAAGGGRPARPKLIVFESLYSMDGDVAPCIRSAISPSATAP